MSTFLSLATPFLPLQDTGAPASSPSGLFQFIPLLLVGVLFFVLLILPERKKQKQRQAMLGALKKGDRVMLTSGMFGTVVSLSEEVVVLQVADGVRLRFTRQAVQSVVDEEKAGATADEKAEPSKV